MTERSISRAHNRVKSQLWENLFTRKSGSYQVCALPVSKRGALVLCEEMAQHMLCRVVASSGFWSRTRYKNAHVQPTRPVNQSLGTSDRPFPQCPLPWIHIPQTRNVCVSADCLRLVPNSFDDLARLGDTALPCIQDCKSLIPRVRIFCAYVSHEQVCKSCVCECANHSLRA